MIVNIILVNGMELLATYEETGLTGEVEDFGTLLSYLDEATTLKFKKVIQLAIAGQGNLVHMPVTSSGLMGMNGKSFKGHDEISIRTDHIMLVVEPFSPAIDLYKQATTSIDISTKIVI